MNPVFPYAHIVAGVLVLLVGFVFQKEGHRFMTHARRITWFLANSTTGLLTILVAWN